MGVYTLSQDEDGQSAVGLRVRLSGVGLPGPRLALGSPQEKAVPTRGWGGLVYFPVISTCTAPIGASACLGFGELIYMGSDGALKRIARVAEAPVDG